MYRDFYAAQDRTLRQQEFADKVAERQRYARPVRARSAPHTDDRLHEAGYRRRYLDGWYLDATRPLRHPKELPGGGWRRMVALQDMPAIPFFRAFRGPSRWVDGRG